MVSAPNPRSRSAIQDKSDDRRNRMDKRAMFYGTYAQQIDVNQYPSGFQEIHGHAQGGEYHRTESRGHVAEQLGSSNYRNTAFSLGPVHKATPQGITDSVGKSTDRNNVENVRSGVHGGTHGETKKHVTRGIGKSQVTKRDGPAATGTLASNWNVTASSSAGGHDTVMGDGNQHSSTRGDRVSYHVGTHVTVNKGERYEDVQEGNKGTVVNGKYKLDTSDTTTINASKDITITSDSKITLRVGESEIELTSDKINIGNPGGDIIEYGNCWHGMDQKDEMEGVKDMLAGGALAKRVWDKPG